MKGPVAKKLAKGLTRREVLAGAAMAAFAAGTPAARAAPTPRQREGSTPRRTSVPLRRYMAAAAALPDGRVLVAGGYDRPWMKGQAPMPLSSAAIYDPGSGSWVTAAPMASPRARHAAVTLDDGRVAMIGGMGMNALASVEIFDPQTNSWEPGRSLTMPRYDHSAALAGGQVFVFGGSAQTMLAGVEAFEPHAGSSLEEKR